MHIAIAANPIAAHFSFIIGFLSIGSPAEQRGSRGRGFGLRPITHGCVELSSWLKGRKGALRGLRKSLLQACVSKAKTANLLRREACNQSISRFSRQYTIAPG